MVGKMRLLTSGSPIIALIKLLNSEAYLYIVEVKNMSSRDPIVGSNPKERFIYFDLVI